MLKLCTNKGFIKKIVIVLLVLAIFNFMLPKPSRASIATTLISPVRDLVVWLGDSVLGLLQSVFMGNGTVVYSEYHSPWWEVLVGVIIAIVAIAGTILLMIVFPPAGIAAAVGLCVKVAIVAGVTYAVITSGLNKSIDIPNMNYSPQEIFSNSVPGLDVNFISPTDRSIYLLNGTPVEKSIFESKAVEGADKKWKPRSGATISTEILYKTSIEAYEKAGDGDTADALRNIEGGTVTITSAEIRQSTGSFLRSIIATWYVAIRNLAVVGLLSVLVYIGIRIILSSTGKDKAKYKAMLMDWVVALCLLVTLQYIMLFAVTMTEQLCGMFAQGSTNLTVPVPLDKDGKVRNFTIDGKKDVPVTEVQTNFIGYARMLLQSEEKDLTYSISWTIIYIAFVGFTLMFTINYLKRLIKLAFFTLMAPIIALMYPLDKVKDGQAQSFQYWVKEYMFSLLLQPVHLLLYTVLITVAFDLAKENMLYTLIVLGFIMTSEKIIKTMLGFDKSGAHTGTMKGLALGTMAGNLLSKVPNVPKGKEDKSLGSGTGGGKVRTQRKVDGNNEKNRAQLPEGQQPPKQRAGINDKNGEADGAALGGGVGGTLGNQQSDEEKEVKKQQAREAFKKLPQGEQEKKIQEALAKQKAAASRGGLEESKKRDEKLLNTSNKYLSPEDQARKARAAQRQRASDTYNAGVRQNQPPRQIQQPQPQQQQKKFTGNNRSKMRGILGAVAPIAGGLGRFAGKTAGRIVTAGALGALGVAGGILSGDIDNMYKMGLAGAGLGFAKGGQLADSAMNIPGKLNKGVDNLVDNFADRYNVNSIAQDDQEKLYIDNHRKDYTDPDTGNVNFDALNDDVSFRRGLESDEEKLYVDKVKNEFKGADGLVNFDALGGDLDYRRDLETDNQRTFFDKYRGDFRDLNGNVKYKDIDECMPFIDQGIDKIDDVKCARKLSAKDVGVNKDNYGEGYIDRIKELQKFQKTNGMSTDRLVEATKIANNTDFETKGGINGYKEKLLKEGVDERTANKDVTEMIKIRKALGKDDRLAKPNPSSGDRKRKFIRRSEMRNREILCQGVEMEESKIRIRIHNKILYQGVEMEIHQGIGNRRNPRSSSQQNPLPRGRKRK